MNAISSNAMFRFRTKPSNMIGSMNVTCPLEHLLFIDEATRAMKAAINALPLCRV
jgi:hypothetical protein